MVRSMRVTSLMTSVRGKENLFGLMVESTSASGKLANSMVSAPTSVKTASQSRASGRMAVRLDGSTRMAWLMTSKMICEL
jgi:hypothetical protein